MLPEESNARVVKRKSCQEKEMSRERDVSKKICQERNVKRKRCQEKEMSREEKKQALSLKIAALNAKVPVHTF